MRVRRRGPSAAAPPPDMSTGNVRVVIPQQRDGHARKRKPTTAEVAPASLWAVQDGAGEIVANGLASRAEALRVLGQLAVQGARLPLVVVDPRGAPTGDRLA